MPPKKNSLKWCTTAKKQRDKEAQLKSLRREYAELEKETEIAAQERQAVSDNNAKARKPYEVEYKRVEKRLEAIRKTSVRESYKKRLDAVSDKFKQLTGKTQDTKSAVVEKETELEAAKACTSKKNTDKLVRDEQKAKGWYQAALKQSKKAINRQVPDLQEKPWKRCKICLEEFTEESNHVPRALNCGHTFCTKCLKSRVNNDQIVCPFDSISTDLENGTVEEALPKNFLVLEM